MPDTTAKGLSKTQLAATLAEQHGITKRQAVDILDSLATIAHDEAKSKGEFTLPGIGKLVRQERAARQGRNPATGASIDIPAKTVLKFRVAKAAKDAVLPPAAGAAKKG